METDSGNAEWGNHEHIESQAALEPEMRHARRQSVGACQRPCVIASPMNELIKRAVAPTNGATTPFVAVVRTIWKPDIAAMKAKTRRT